MAMDEELRDYLREQVEMAVQGGYLAREIRETLARHGVETEWNGSNRTPRASVSTRWSAPGNSAIPGAA